MFIRRGALGAHRLRIPPQRLILGSMRPQLEPVHLYGPLPAVRGIVVQQRFLLGPLFRVARSGFSLAAGAAAGGFAYTNYKINQASSSASEAFGQAKEWIGSIWDKVPELPNYPVMTPDSSSQASQGNGQTFGAEANAGNNGGNGSYGGGANGGQGSSGGSGGPGGQAEAVSAVTAVATIEGDNSDVEMDVDEQEQGMINLTRKMIEIRNILLQIDGTESVQMPSIVVVGSQSSGKSSVLEAMVGHEFLPKGFNMVTRRPIELTLIHTPGSDSEHCELPVLRTGPISDFREVQRILTDLNKSVSSSEVVSDEPIQLRVYSPHVPDLTMIDLPGYIQVVAADQPLELKSRIADLCEKYIQAPNIILAVSAADVDLANSAALKASRRVDPRGERTIGVITKMDLVDAERGRSILLNREYPLRLGYVGVVTRYNSPLFGTASNLTSTISATEKEFFAKPEYGDLDCGVLRLRRKLMRVLESSMSRSLEPVTREIQRELEEAAYQFKVQYNDRVLTPQTYLARSADAFKAGFQDMTSQFGRDQIRELVKRSLDQKVLDLLAERYWNLPPGMELDRTTNVAAELRHLDPKRADLLSWQARLDQSSAAITKLGVGRMSAQMLVNAVDEQMQSLVEKTSFKNHPLAIDAIKDATHSILSSKFYSTADQVENSIKPYKYEVDIDSREWNQAREQSYSLLKEELRQCETSLDQLKESVGRSKLTRLMRSLDDTTASNSSEDLTHFSNSLLSQVRSARFLSDRCDLLRARIAFVRSSKCRSRKNRAYCPEVFLEAVSDKLTATAVLFLNFEMLSDFYYSFPRALDAKLASLSEHDVEVLATQDPRIKRHVDLQRRRELLQLALSKLQTVREIRNNYEH